MLDELIGNYFAKQEEIRKLEDSIKEIKQGVKETKKSVDEISNAIARLMKESKHESFLLQKDGKNFVVRAAGYENVITIEEVPTLNDVKIELSVDRMLKGSKEIAAQESVIPGYNVNGLPLKIPKKRTPKKATTSWTLPIQQLEIIKNALQVFDTRAQKEDKDEPF
jgi:cell division septum initiation protein DivIVA